MKKRIITAAILVGILIPTAIFPEVSWLFKIIFLLFSGIGSYEMLKMYETKEEVNLLFKITTILFTVLMTFLFVFPFDSKTVLNYDFKYFLIFLMLIVIFYFVVSIFIKDFNLNHIGRYLLIILIVSLGSGSLLLLHQTGLYLLAYVLLITFVTDTFAYIIGSLFGKHKMAPLISKNKSWEGAIAGTLIAGLLVSLFSMNIDVFLKPGSFLNKDGVTTIFDNVNLFINTSVGLKWLLAFITTFSLSVIGQMGDLIFSKIKRTYEIKDFSNILPGHGGILDRFDSSFFVSLVLVFIFFALSI